MKNFLDSVASWFATPVIDAAPNGIAQGHTLSDYDSKVRALEQRSGKLFLP
jgi:hypothetical protein